MPPRRPSARVQAAREALNLPDSKPLIIAAGTYIAAYHWAGERGLATRDWAYVGPIGHGIRGLTACPYVVLDGFRQHPCFHEIGAVLTHPANGHYLLGDADAR